MGDAKRLGPKGTIIRFSYLSLKISKLKLKKADEGTAAVKKARELEISWLGLEI